MRKPVVVSLVSVVLACLALSAGTWPQDANNKADQGVYHKDVDLVSVYFTVRDNKKQLASELAEDRFRVLEDGHEQPIKFFAHHSDVVLNVGVLLDTGTNTAWLLDEEAQASSLFLKHVVRPKDLGFVMKYAARVETVQLPTSDTAMLEQSVQSIRVVGGGAGMPSQPPPSSRPIPGMGGGMPHGGPGIGGPGATGQPYNSQREAHLYDALRVSTMRYLSREVGRKAVVVVALSGDSRSESTLENALEVLLQNDVIAYVLQISDGPRERSHFDRCDVVHTYDRDQHGEYLLKKLAEATGGRMLEVRGADRLEAALDEISNELHHQYSLGYYPANRNWDGKFRKIQIEAREHGYTVFARKGYYATPRDGASGGR